MHDDLMVRKVAAQWIVVRTAKSRRRAGRQDCSVEVIAGCLHRNRRQIGAELDDWVTVARRLGHEYVIAKLREATQRALSPRRGPQTKSEVFSAMARIWTLQRPDLADASGAITFGTEVRRGRPKTQTSSDDLATAYRALGAAAYIARHGRVDGRSDTTSRIVTDWIKRRAHSEGEEPETFLLQGEGRVPVRKIAHRLRLLKLESGGQLAVEKRISRALRATQPKIPDYE